MQPMEHTQRKEYRGIKMRWFEEWFCGHCIFVLQQMIDDNRGDVIKIEIVL